MSLHAGRSPILELPDPSHAQTVIAAPGRGPGNWAGAATATVVDGEVWLTYRVRRPVGVGRGVAAAVARSTDGFTFTTVAEIARGNYGAESFERPALVRLPSGTWRLYLSCATPGSKHWWVEAVDAPTPEELPTGTRTIVLPGDETVGVKDPVIHIDESGLWHVWYTRHPLNVPGHEDRMTTAHAVSQDGLSWYDHTTVLRPSGPDSWDARGARVTAVLSTHPLLVTYDGRASAEENWFEATGVATGALVALHAMPGIGPLRSSESEGACRYVSVVTMPDRTRRWYFELARADGSHDLVTWPPQDA